MKRLLFPLCLLVFLAGAPSAMAADVPIPNGGRGCRHRQRGDGWGQNAWGTNTPGVHASQHRGSQRHTLVAGRRLRLHRGRRQVDATLRSTVTGGKYYRFSDWYKSNADTAVSMYWQTADQAGREPGVDCDVTGQPTCGTWSNLETGIEPSADWKKFESGIDMPAGAVQATFVHFIARNGFLQTDDYALEQLDSPPGFKRPLVSLTFDDSTPNLYNYVIPELDKRGVQVDPVRGDGRDRRPRRRRRALPVERRADQGRAPARSRDRLAHGVPPQPRHARAPARCARARTPDPPDLHGGARRRVPRRVRRRRPRTGSWLDPFGGTNLWLRPATIGSPSQNLADTTLAQELGDSKRKLEGHIGYGVPTIAYPFGSYDSTVVAEEKALGYKAGALGRRGLQLEDRSQPVQDQGPEHPAGRLHGHDDRRGHEGRRHGGHADVSPTSTMSADTTTKQFKDWVEKAKANNYWLVLVYHPVGRPGREPVRHLHEALRGADAGDQGRRHRGQDHA